LANNKNSGNSELTYEHELIELGTLSLKDRYTS